MDHLNVGKKIRNPDEASLSFNLSSFDISPAIYRTPPFQSILESGAPLVCRVFFFFWLRSTPGWTPYFSYPLIGGEENGGTVRNNQHSLPSHQAITSPAPP
ncbi:hypothetical protein EPI10_007497 [Gossypium australe]|uniref:Uncharacterized protein n=1 Tax=Gossypium australe TaxID=47621 RepID=A0A5B6WUC7_9ROSI|nr:hypothetical protein EPI10_007497 [Gossypium australe]